VRRGFHLAAGLVLVYYLLPSRVLGFPNAGLLLASLAIGLALEGLRWAGWIRLPGLRPYEQQRPASFVYFAVAIVVAILVLPEAIAAAVILGAALVDPVIGELRGRRLPAGTYPILPLVAYAAVAAAALRGIGGWTAAGSVAGAALAGVVAIAVERARIPYVDDDLTMVLAPALALAVAVALVPALA
jgi:hypothetical protein